MVLEMVPETVWVPVFVGCLEIRPTPRVCNKISPLVSVILAGYTKRNNRTHR